jgi:hypothetical protein
MQLATKTLQAIEEALQKDQGAKFKGLLGQLMPLAGDAYSTKEDDWRDHLGASLIGRECARSLWYSFRWATLKRFDGRMIRLFNRGHLEEPRFVALLVMIGCEVWQVNDVGKQFRIRGHRGHFGGSLDGVARGIPDIPNEPVLTEFKTHGEKSFLKLVKEGLIAAKWEHFVQMQVYMGKNSLNWGLYCAISKNTDELHMELIQFDPTQYQRYLDRSAMIIDSIEPPPKINNSPGWFGCRLCDHKSVCHSGEIPAENCRTCVHSRVGDEGLWFCMEPTADAAFGDNPEITPEDQRLGCEQYEANPVFKK